MNKIRYKITFHSYWHCGSGLSAGSDVDALVIKDKDGLPFIPGKTMKGLIREAFEQYVTFIGKPCEDLIEDNFGLPVEEGARSKQGKAFFSNAIINEEERKVILSHHLEQYMYSAKASTSIDRDGVAASHTLRRFETVVPCTLIGEILEIDEKIKPDLEKSLGMIKRIGVNRNRGLGRCTISIINEGGNA